jgi:orotidine 5'-phosphate decarboxylase subfamily 1
MLVPSLQELAERYNFLIFEDRKFADIGNTVSLQYSAGIYRIVDWADLVTVHAVPGPGGVAGLKKAVGDRIRGGFLLVEMSSAGNLCTPEYRASALAIAQTHSDFVVGFIAMSPTHENFLTITPGVQLASKGDGLGQTYRDPKTVVKAGSDVIVVGRGITGAKDVEEAAALYQREGWEGYLERINS